MGRAEARALDLGTFRFSDVVEAALRELVGEFPGCRTAFSVIQADHTFRVVRSFEPAGMPELEGFCATVDPTSAYMRRLRAGEAWIMDDAAREPLVDPDLLGVFERYRVRALIDQPILVSGRFAALLCVDAPAPRAWSEAEVGVVRSTGAVVAALMARERDRGPSEDGAIDLGNREIRHEVANAMQAVLIGLERMREGLLAPAGDGLSEDMVESLESTIEAATLVPEILDRFASIAADDSWEPRPLTDLVQRAVAIAQPAALKRDVTLDMSVQATPRVLVDPATLVQVLLNLMLNAFDALDRVPEGRPRRVTVTVEPSRGPMSAVLVEDTGSGVDPVHRERIFEPAYSSRLDRGGSGLGLFLSQQFVASMGGRLELLRTGPEGTCFRVAIPRADG